MVHNRIDPSFTRYLDSDGRPLGELPAWAGDSDALVGLYRQMLLTRLFDQKAVALQRTGRIGTYAPTLGQEAIGVAIGSQMRAEDVLVPYYRDTAVQLMRGVRMEDILLYWGGDERGSDYAEPLAAQDFPICVPIATQALHACGVASAFRIRGEHRVAVTTCGDGATSKGDFLEALNVAGAWQLPVLFVVNNNQWAISVPRRIQCGAPTLAEKAVGAGFPANRWTATTCWRSPSASAWPWSARARARPTLLECISYRLCDHTTADDASRYRSAEEVSQAWREEPIKRLRAFLAGRGQWDEEREQALVGECQARVQEAVERFETFAAQGAAGTVRACLRALAGGSGGAARAIAGVMTRGGREGPNMNERNGEAKRLALLEAVNLALHRAMAEDETVVVLGEDVGVNGGCFAPPWACASASASSGCWIRRWRRT